MDNTTKALLIAAAVLIVIIIIALSVRVLNVNDDSADRAGELVQSKTGDASKRTVDEIGKIGQSGSSQESRWILINDADNSGTITVGDKYKLNGTNEEFYVIKTPVETDTTVILLTAKCINTSTWQQDDKYTRVPFSKTPVTNIYANASIKNLVDNYVTNTLSISKGRLMTYEEARALKGTKYNNILCANPNKVNFWLGSPCKDKANYVWIVNGGNGTFVETSVTNSSDYGVRPVIEISKSNI